MKVKKILSLILAAMMLFGCITVTAFAETDKSATTSSSTSGSGIVVNKGNGGAITSIRGTNVLVLETDATYADSNDIDQFYTFKQDGDTTYTDITKVKLEWTITDITATYTSNKTWDPDNLVWKETKTLGEIADKTATFKLTNYSSKKVVGTVSFKAEDAVSATLKSATFDENNGAIIDTVVNTDYSIDDTKKASVPNNTITATLSFSKDKDDYKELSATTKATKYGTYTVTISAAPTVKSYSITNILYFSTADTYNATTIKENGTVTLKYTTDSGYPDCLGVKNATLESYDKTTGTLVISNPTDDVVIMDANYLSFTANQDNSSVTIRFEQGSYEYSTNNGATWTSGENSFLGDGGTTIELKKAGDTVLVKGTNCSCYNIEMEGAYWSFAMTGSISAGGSLTSVTDGLGIDKEVTLSISCYEKIFKGCTSLTTAPELPATTLAESCYREMFAGCTSLTSGPEELPAKILSDYCYSGMFYDCIKLTTAPKLSATTLADSCCQAMFSGCTALTNVPEELSVTDLCEDCYLKMFENCTSLTTAPKLPAVNLKDGCYSNMFIGCTSLTTAPELSATNISDFCYWSMFDGCTALKITTVKPTTGTEGTDWGVIISGAKTVEGTKPTTDMFNGCACAFGINATPTFAEGTTYYWYK